MAVTSESKEVALINDGFEDNMDESEDSDDEIEDYNLEDPETDNTLYCLVTKVLPLCDFPDPNYH